MTRYFKMKKKNIFLIIMSKGLMILYFLKIIGLIPMKIGRLISFQG